MLVSFALVVFKAIEQGSEIFDFTAQREDPHFCRLHGALEVSKNAQHFAQFALHGERAFGTLFAAGDGHVVEALAALGEEEGVGIFKRKRARVARVRDDVAVTKFGQNYFKRFAKAIQNADGVLQWEDGVVGRRGPVLIHAKRKLCL